MGKGLTLTKCSSDRTGRTRDHNVFGDPDVQAALKMNAGQKNDIKAILTDAENRPSPAEGHARWLRRTAKGRQRRPKGQRRRRRRLSRLPRQPGNPDETPDNCQGNQRSLPGSSVSQSKGRMGRKYIGDEFKLGGQADSTRKKGGRQARRAAKNQYQPECKRGPTRPRLRFGLVSLFAPLALVPFLQRLDARPKDDVHPRKLVENYFRASRVCLPHASKAPASSRCSKAANSCRISLNPFLACQERQHPCQAIAHHRRQGETCQAEDDQWFPPAAERSNASWSVPAPISMAAPKSGIKMASD